MYPTIFLQCSLTSIVTRWKTHSDELISPEMYKKTYTKTSGNLLKIVVVKNDIKFP